MPKRRSAPRKRITDKVGKELRSARLSASPRVVTAGKPRYPALTAGSCPDAETPDERVYSSAPARAVARASAFKSGTASSGHRPCSTQGDASTLSGHLRRFQAGKGATCPAAVVLCAGGMVRRAICPAGNPQGAGRHATDVSSRGTEAR